MRSQLGMRLAATLGQSESLRKWKKLRDRLTTVESLRESDCRNGRPTSCGCPVGTPRPAYALRTLRRNLTVGKEEQLVVGAPAGLLVLNALCLRPTCALQTFHPSCYEPDRPTGETQLWGTSPETPPPLPLCWIGNLGSFLLSTGRSFAQGITKDPARAVLSGRLTSSRWCTLALTLHLTAFPQSLKKNVPPNL